MPAPPEYDDIDAGDPDAPPLSSLWLSVAFVVVLAALIL